MNKKITFVILYILIPLLCFNSTVLAESIDTLQDKKSELQTQIEKSNKEVNQIQIDLTENLEQLNDLNSKIEVYQSDIAEYEEQISGVKNEINGIVAELKILEESYNTQKENLQSRIVSLYEAGDILYLDVLLKSSSFSDFISNYFLIGEIIQSDNDLLGIIERQKVKIEEVKHVLEQKEERLQTIKDNKEKTAIALENSKIIRNSYINKLTEEEKVTQAKIVEYKKELEQIEAEITKISMGSSGNYVGGVFAWPLPLSYTHITSYFGYRKDPFHGGKSFHSGVDIGVPKGTDVYAVNAGRVMYTNVGWGGRLW